MEIRDRWSARSARFTLAAALLGVAAVTQGVPAQDSQEARRLQVRNRQLQEELRVVRSEVALLRAVLLESSGGEAVGGALDALLQERSWQAQGSGVKAFARELARELDGDVLIDPRALEMPRANGPFELSGRDLVIAAELGRWLDEFFGLGWRLADGAIVQIVPPDPAAEALRFADTDDDGLPEARVPMVDAEGLADAGEAAQPVPVRPEDRPADGGGTLNSLRLVSEVVQLRADLEAARQQAQRLRPMCEKGVVPQDELLRSEQDARRLDRQLAVAVMLAESEREAVALELEYRRQELDGAEGAARMRLRQRLVRLQARFEALQQALR